VLELRVGLWYCILKTIPKFGGEKAYWLLINEELYFEANRIPEYKMHRAIKALRGSASIQRLGGNDSIQMRNGGRSQKFYNQRGSSFPPLNHFLFILTKFLDDLLTYFG